MPSNKPYIQIRTTPIIQKKFEYIAQQDNRSMSNLGEYIIIQYIRKYEQENGEIPMNNANQ